MAFRKIDISELSFNPFDKIGKQWMLLTGGDKDSFNTMTASWGQLGVLWNKNVLTCYIRPNRYTYDFVEKGECFTASFYGEEYRSKETGLTPAEVDGCMAFEEAELVLVCRKLYSYDLQESGFLTDDGIPEKFFGTDPYHRAYISEIVGVYVKD